MIESLKKGDSRSFQIIFGELLVLGLLAGCSADAVASKIPLPPATQPKPEETDPAFDLPEISPLPSETAPRITLGVTMNPPRTSTPPTEAGLSQACFPETVRTEIEASFPANETFVTLSEGKFREAIGLESQPAVVAEVLGDATNRISALAGYYAKYPGFGINRIVVPADIEPADVKRAIGQIELATGSDLTVVKYVTGIDFSGPETALMAIHVGVNGGNWGVFAWTNGGSVGTRLGVRQRSDGTWQMNGIVHVWTTTQDGRRVLAEVPAQLVNGRPDVAIVDGCPPMIVKVDNNGQVTEIFDEEISFITADNEVDKGAVVWKKAQAGAAAEPEATAELPPGLEKLTPPGGSARYEAGENGVNWIVISDKANNNTGRAIFRVESKVIVGQDGSFPGEISLDGKKVWVKAGLTQEENSGLKAGGGDENLWSLEWIGGVWRRLPAEKIPSCPELLSQSIGPSWKEGFTYYDKTNELNVIKMYVDGEYILFPEIDLKIGEGQFMDVIVAVKGWYLDSRGREQFVYLPVLTRFPDGRLNRTGFMFPYDIVDWSYEEILQNLKNLDPDKAIWEYDAEASSWFLNEGLEMQGGRPAFIAMLVNSDINWFADIDYSKVPPEYKYHLGLLKQWTEANPESLEKFLDTGDPAIEAFFVADFGEISHLTIKADSCPPASPIETTPSSRLERMGD